MTMQRTFDYGERTFKVMITPALDLEVYDQSGKKVKNLPRPLLKRMLQLLNDFFSAVNGRRIEHPAWRCA